jgi:hypothetical protein
MSEKGKIDSEIPPSPPIIHQCSMVVIFCMAMTWLWFAFTCLHNAHILTHLSLNLKCENMYFIVYFIVSMSSNNQGTKIIKYYMSSIPFYACCLPHWNVESFVSSWPLTLGSWPRLRLEHDKGIELRDRWSWIQKLGHIPTNMQKCTKK